MSMSRRDDSLRLHDMLTAARDAREFSQPAGIADDLPQSIRELEWIVDKAPRA